LRLLASHAHKLSRHQAVATSSFRSEAFIQKKAVLIEYNILHYVPLPSRSLALTLYIVTYPIQNGILAIQPIERSQPSATRTSSQASEDEQCHIGVYPRWRNTQCHDRWTNLLLCCFRRSLQHDVSRRRSPKSHQLLGIAPSIDRCRSRDESTIQGL
jgi:hypothetical protein